MSVNPWVTPIYLPGKEPMSEGTTDADRQQMAQVQYWSKMTSMAMESCPVKCVMSGAMGFALGGFFSLLSASFAIDDPLRRSNLQAAAMANANPGAPPPPEPTTMQQTRTFFKETGKGMYRSGKGFGKVGALYSGVECILEGFRAKNDLTNPILAGFISGGILARNAGPQAIIGGGIAFAGFSGAIDWYMRRPSSSEDD